MVALLWRNERSQRVSSTSPDICHIYIITYMYISYYILYYVIPSCWHRGRPWHCRWGRERTGARRSAGDTDTATSHLTPAVTFLQWSLCSHLSAVISLPFCSDFSAVISLQSPFCSHLTGCTVIRWYEIESEWNPTPVDEFYFPGKTLNISISHNFNSNKFSIHI